jgi:hypothetical protein
VRGQQVLTSSSGPDASSSGSVAPDPTRLPLFSSSATSHAQEPHPDQRPGRAWFPGRARPSYPLRPRSPHRLPNEQQSRARAGRGCSEPEGGDDQRPGRPARCRADRLVDVALCPPSAPVGQIEGFRERRNSGSSRTWMPATRSPRWPASTSAATSCSRTSLSTPSATCAARPSASSGWARTRTCCCRSWRRMSG